MANYVMTDKGDYQIAEGAPGSKRRLQIERPKLIESLRDLRRTTNGTQIAVSMIHSASITSPMETRSLLELSGFTV